MAKITTQEFADKVELTRGRIIQLIASGELPAEKFGSVYMVDEKHIDKIKNRPETRGRKPKSTKRRVAA